MQCILPSHHLKFRDQPWRHTYIGTLLLFVAAVFSAKVSLMLDNPFLVPFLCKLKFTSVFLSRRAWKSSAIADSLQRHSRLFRVIPCVLHRLVNFKMAQRFLSKYLVFPDYLSIFVTMSQPKVMSCQTI